MFQTGNQSYFTAYAMPDQVCQLAGANSTMIQTCIHNFLQFENMSNTSYQKMQNDIHHQREQVQHDQVLDNATQSGQYKVFEPYMARQSLNNDLNERQWYNDWMQSQQAKMMLRLKYWQEYDHNPNPQPNCPAWHECGPNGVPLNQTQLNMEIERQNSTLSKLHQNDTIPTIYLKPEMLPHPSGFVNETNVIQNWQEFEQWMERHLNKTSTN